MGIEPSGQKPLDRDPPGQTTRQRPQTETPKVRDPTLDRDAP